MPFLSGECPILDADVGLYVGEWLAPRLSSKPGGVTFMSYLGEEPDHFVTPRQIARVFAEKREVK